MSLAAKNLGKDERSQSDHSRTGRPGVEVGLVDSGTQPGAEV